MCVHACVCICLREKEREREKPDGFGWSHTMLNIAIRTVSSSDYPDLETLVRKISSEKQPFERLEVAKEDLLKIFEVIILYKLTSQPYVCSF